MKYAGAEAPDVWKALIDKAKDGHVKAIKLYFELIGEYQQTYRLINDTKVEFVFTDATKNKDAIETTAKDIGGSDE